MKKIILGLLLAGLASPAIAQSVSTEQVYLLGKKTGGTACMVIWNGGKTKGDINQAMAATFTPQDKNLWALTDKLRSQYGNEHKMINSLDNGFLDGINPCYDEYVKLFGYP